MTTAAAIVAGTDIVAGGSITAGGGADGSGGMFADHIIVNQVFQANPFTIDDGNDTDTDLTWPSAPPTIAKPADPDIEVNTDTTPFAHQTDYAVGTLYQTLTQQQLALGDTITKATGSWSFSGNEGSHGTPWPGAGATEMSTSAGDPLTKPSINVKFTNQPAAMQAQPITLKTT